MDFLRVLANIRNGFLTLVFSGFTQLAGEVVLLAVLAVIFWCISKKTAYRLAFAYMLSSLTINNLKIIFRVPRPWKLDPDFKPVESALADATGYSFPSGHTCAATSLYGTLALTVKKVWAKVLFCIIILGVIFSRMYLGVHTPLDVSVSFAVTAVITLACWFISNKSEVTRSKKFLICGLFAAYTIFSLVLDLVLNAKGLVDISNAADGCKTAGAALGFLIGWFIETEYINFDTKTQKWYQQVLKVLLGVAVLMVIKEGLKFIFKGCFGIEAVVDGVSGTYEPLLLSFVRYTLMVLWAIGLYPIVIKKLFNQKKEPEKAE